MPSTPSEKKASKNYYKAIKAEEIYREMKALKNKEYYIKNKEILAEQRKEKYISKKGKNNLVVNVVKIGEEITPVENIPDFAPVEVIPDVIPVEVIPDLIDIIQVEPIKPIEEIKPEIIEEIKPEIIEIKPEIIEEIKPEIIEIKPIENIPIENTPIIEDIKIIPILEDKKHDEIDEIDEIDETLTDDVIKNAIREQFIYILDNELSTKRQDRHFRDVAQSENWFCYPKDIEPINKITSNNIPTKTPRSRTLNKYNNTLGKQIKINATRKTLKKIMFNY